jgi:processive 1,2-diacylglycerol beta-glucosyltransferase
MATLYDKNSGELLGNVSEAQLRFLVDQLEEESLYDRDYSLTPMTLEYLRSQGADGELLALLERALGSRPEVIVLWTRGEGASAEPGDTPEML